MKKYLPKNEWETFQELYTKTEGVTYHDTRNIAMKILSEILGPDAIKKIEPKHPTLTEIVTIIYYTINFPQNPQPPLVENLLDPIDMQR